MHIKIDQSGKIEDTRQDTVVAFSNRKSKSILIDRREKRKLKQFFRKENTPHLFPFKTFAVLLFLLIKDNLADIEEIIIDIEYSGQDALIKTLLMQEIYKIYPAFDKDRISFRRIGRKANAHQKAIDTFRRKRKPDLIVKADDIITLIIKRK